MKTIDQYARPGKHTVHVGDTVDVAGVTVQITTSSGTPIEFDSKGWTRTTVHELAVGKSGKVIAKVTGPNGTARFVNADRLTRKKGGQ